MPSARIAAGSPSWTEIRATRSAGTSVPISSPWRRIALRFRIGMIPGRIGISTPRARTRSTRLEVVRGPEEHLGHRELGPGARLRHEHVRVRVPRRRRRMTLGERRHADPEVAARARQLDQLDRVGQPARGRRPLRPRPVARVAAQQHHVLDPLGGVRVEDPLELRAGVPDAGQVGHRGQRGVAGDPAGDADGLVAGAAAGAVGHRDEVGPVGLEGLDRRPQRLLAGLVLGREELERERALPLLEELAHASSGSRGHGRV